MSAFEIANKAGQMVPFYLNTIQIQVQEKEKAKGIQKGDRVIIYLGGDDGSASANGISAYIKVDGKERFIGIKGFVTGDVTVTL